MLPLEITTQPQPHHPPIGYFVGIVNYQPPEEQTEEYGGMVPYCQQLRGTDFKVTVFTDETTTLESNSVYRIKRFPQKFKRSRICSDLRCGGMFLLPHSDNATWILCYV